MDIYVGRLPATATPADLRQFFQAFQRDATFEVVHIQGRGGEFIYGHVVIPHERRAQKAMRRLNLQPLNGHRVVVREFQYRATANERRALNWRSLPWKGRERRLGERRTPRETPSAAKG